MSSSLNPQDDNKNQHDKNQHDPLRSEDSLDLSRATIGDNLQTARLYFQGNLEHVLQVVIGKPDLISSRSFDYIVDTMTEFIRADAVSIRTLTGRPITALGEMVENARQYKGEAELKAQVQVGKFALFYGGFYRNMIASCEKKMKPELTVGFYIRQGALAFDRASHLEPQVKKAEVLGDVSAHFQAYSYILGEVKEIIEKDRSSNSGFYFKDTHLHGR